MSNDRSMITREQALKALDVVNSYEERLAALRFHLLNMV